MKSKDDIFADVRAMLATMLNLPPANVTPHSHLYDDLDFDSLDTIDMMVAIEKYLGRRLGADVFMDVRTVGAVVDELHALQARAA